METIWYITYKGIPFSLQEKGFPVHFDQKYKAGDIERFATKQNKLDPKGFGLKSMPRRMFYSKKWPL